MKLTLLRVFPQPDIALLLVLNKKSQKHLLFRKICLTCNNFVIAIAEQILSPSCHTLIERKCSNTEMMAVVVRMRYTLSVGTLLLNRNIWSFGYYVTAIEKRNAGSGFTEIAI